LGVVGGRDWSFRKVVTRVVTVAVSTESDDLGEGVEFRLFNLASSGCKSVRVAICQRPATINSPKGAYEFMPLWGFLVFLLYAMRRVDCRRCHAVAVEEVPWGNGKHQLTNAYMLF
jgi:hypothetical protein